MKIKGYLTKTDNKIILHAGNGTWDIGNYSEVVACNEYASNVMLGVGVCGHWTHCDVEIEALDNDHVGIGKYRLSAYRFREKVEEYMEKLTMERIAVDNKIEKLGGRFNQSSNKVVLP